MLAELGVDYCDGEGNFDLSRVDDGTVGANDRFVLWAKYRVPHVWEKLVEQKKLEEADEEKARV